MDINLYIYLGCLVLSSYWYTNIKNIYNKSQRRIETRINSNLPIFVSIISLFYFSFKYLFPFFYLCVYNSCSVILARVVLLMIFFRFWRAAMTLQAVLRTIVTSSVAVGIPLVPLLLNVKHLVRVCDYIWGMHEMLTIMLSVVILLKLFMLPNEQLYGPNSISKKLNLTKLFCHF